MIRGYRFRLYPTPEQAATLERWMGVCRFIYNAAHWQRANLWRQCIENTGKHISFASQSLELTQARAENSWIDEVPRVMLEYALRDLDTAYQRFFKGVSAYPKPRRKADGGSFRFKGRETRVAKLSGRWSTVSVPKLGLVKFRDTRQRLGEIVNATISYRAGKWHVSMAHEIEHVAPASDLPSVGIDRGIANTITLSTGEMLSVPASLTTVERRQRRAKRVLSRRQRGSARYAKQRRRVAALGSRVARVRRDWHHKVTTDLARRFGCVAVEALKVKSMTASGTRKRGLNRSILNQGWGIFTELLVYKLEERGGTLLTVDPAYTSQTCSECGAIDAESRESQARFVCRHCGHKAHADVNAAINILRRSTPVTLVEVARWGADEARTVNHVAFAA